MKLNFCRPAIWSSVPGGCCPTLEGLFIHVKKEFEKVMKSRVDTVRETEKQWWMTQCQQLLLVLGDPLYYSCQLFQISCIIHHCFFPSMPSAKEVLRKHFCAASLLVSGFPPPRSCPCPGKGCPPSPASWACLSLLGCTRGRTEGYPGGWHARCPMARVDLPASTTAK